MTKSLFYLLVLLLPVNLGYHFIFKWNYVDGILVDYLIPTLFVQDILVGALILGWSWEIFSKNKRLADLGWFSRILFLFLIALFLSVLVSVNFYASLYAFLRVFLYVLFCLYVSHNFDFAKDFSKIAKILAISLIFLEVLAFGQWLKQSALFNNYLFFGEQPYNFSTFGIARENLFGSTVLPVYGLFRHPNIFGGFLSVVLLWLFWAILEQKSKFRLNLLTTALLAGIPVLVLTFSWTAILAFLAGLAFLTISINWPRLKQNFMLFIILLPFLLISFVLPLAANLYPNAPSVYRRADFYTIAFSSIQARPLFGWGLNTSPILTALFVQSEQLVKYTAFELKYPQPVHNIFLVIFAEAGIFAFLFYILLFALVLFKSAKIEKTVQNPGQNPNTLFKASFLQFMILGLFDHYLVTIHQPLLLFWLTLGICTAYNKHNVQ